MNKYNSVAVFRNRGSSVIDSSGKSNGPSRLSSQLILSMDEKLDDRVGLGPALLLDDQARTIETNAFDGYVLLASDEQVVQDYLAEQEAIALLIRPDRYIFGKATSSNEVTRLIVEWHQAIN